MSDAKSDEIFPELQDAKLQDLGTLVTAAAERARRAEGFEKNLQVAKNNGYIVIAFLFAVVIVLGIVIWRQKHALEEVNRKISAADNALNGIRTHAFGERFVVSDRRHFVAFPVGTTFDTRWTCPSPDGDKEPCVQIIPAR